jgi:hypothetical protein
MTCAHKPAKILIVDTTPSEKERASKCKGLLGNYKSEIVVSSWQRHKSVYVYVFLAQLLDTFVLGEKMWTWRNSESAKN